MGTLREDLCEFMICRCTFLRMINVSDRSCAENQNTHFMFYNFLFENPAAYEIPWKNMARLDRLQMTIY